MVKAFPQNLPCVSFLQYKISRVLQHSC
uniref:Uncharacterized protein n=1 Tax=Rhizophora mucronata TaxID=61149 RepID=A0A2P2QT72_RHIMU